MELWIRSQDKGNLVVANSLEVEAKNKGTYEIWNYNHNYHLSFLGEYKTKERALEVLDEIQGKIAQNECLKSMISKLSNVKGEEEKIGKLFKEMIYEMPKE